MEAPSAYFMKSPPKQFSDEQAREMVEAFIREYAQDKKKPKEEKGASKPEKDG